MTHFKKIYQKFFILFFVLFSVFVGIFLLLEIKKTEMEIQKISLAQVLKISHLKNRSITLMLVGDIMLDRGVEYVINSYGGGDYKFPFLKIADYLKEADILFGNLEGPISNKGERVGSIYSFRNNLAVIEGLNFAGFDILSVANNHIFDYGREAIEDTFNRLKTAGIDYVGGGFNEIEAYSPIIREVNGTKIAFLAYTNLGSKFWAAKGEELGIAWLEKERMEKEVKEAKSQADIVITSFHYGEEYYLEPTSFQVSISRAAIDAGADLVIGHHPHVAQKIEKYRTGYIAYSLGNFVFDQGFSEETTKGLILKVLVENGKIKKIIPIEIEINKLFQPELLKALLRNPEN
jgi:poly-gamma-glutamate synthesis protein (capsule biosynthesis protein)